MKKLDINTDNGTILLPNGYSVSPFLTQETFYNSRMFGKNGHGSSGMPPWMHYSCSGGNVSGKDLILNLCFHDQALISVTISVDFYPPGPKDWSVYSLDIETSIKQCHDTMLKEMLGNPDRSDMLADIHPDASHEALYQPLKWIYYWGSIMSSHDFKGGGTYIIINYNNKEAV